MRYICFFILSLPITIMAQDKNQPYVRFDEGIILFYLPSQSAYPLLLPAYKPGFVHIVQTLGFQSQSNQEISGHLSSDIVNLISHPLSVNQKTEFLEKYACLILLNYSRVSTLDTLFSSTARTLCEDPVTEINTNAKLVVRMYEMYLKEERK